MGAREELQRIVELGEKKRSSLTEVAARGSVAGVIPGLFAGGALASADGIKQRQEIQKIKGIGERGFGDSGWLYGDNSARGQYPGGEGWKPDGSNGGEKPFQKGEFNHGERSARAIKGIEGNMSKRANRRIGAGIAGGMALAGGLSVMAAISQRKNQELREAKKLAQTTSMSTKDKLQSIVRFKAGYGELKRHVVWDSESGRYGDAILPENKKGIGAHINRNIGKYIGVGSLGALGVAGAAGGAGPGALMLPVIGAMGGSLVDDVRRNSHVKKQLKTQRRIEDYSERLMSARDQLDSIINFGGDPRPRDPLGRFDDEDNGGVTPESTSITYKQPGNSVSRDLAIGAGGSVIGAGAIAGGGKLREMLGRLKGGKVKLSAREELDVIKFGYDFFGRTSREGAREALKSAKQVAGFARSTKQSIREIKANPKEFGEDYLEKYEYDAKLAGFLNKAHYDINRGKALRREAKKNLIRDSAITAGALGATGAGVAYANREK